MTTADEVVTKWLDEITTAKKREKTYRTDGRRIVDIYSGYSPDVIPFNILFSNTETLLPALYSAIPRPIVRRRFKDEDPLGKAASEAGQRVLEFLLDTNIDGYETFDAAVRVATLDALLPGRGITAVKYDAEILDVESPQEAESESYKQSELVCCDAIHWNRAYFGYAKKWSKVPWIAYEEYIDREEAVRLFGESVTTKIVFNKGEESSTEDRTQLNEDKGQRETALIYQIWDKSTKKIRYISPQYAGGYLKVEDDPLGFTGFFNCPEPIQFMEKSGDLLPTALYLLYENQAKELNEITRRISRIARAIKARGIYDSELGDDIQNLFEADDNEMVPADKSSSLAAEKGLQNAIWFAPIETLVNVLQTLYTARENCKQVIFEITGIADIMRGQTSASETLGAQQIKQSWGTLRLKRMQKEVQRYARDLLRMMLELAATKFSEDTWAKMTGLPYVTTQQRQQLDMIANAARMSGQQLDPQTQAALQAPVWGEVIGLLRTDLQRAYRIDIETNSTLAPEAAEDQQNIAELMNSLGQFLNGIGPLIKEGVMPFGAAQAMMIAIVKRYSFGEEIEDEIKQMKAPPAPTGPPPEQIKAQQDQQNAEAQRKHDAAIAQGTEERIRAVEMAKHQRQSESEQNNLQIETAKLEVQRETQMMQLQAEREMFDAKLAYQRESDQHKAQMTMDTECKKACIAAEAQVEVAKINAQSKMELLEEQTEPVDSPEEDSGEEDSQEGDSGEEDSGEEEQGGCSGCSDIPDAMDMMANMHGMGSGAIVAMDAMGMTNLGDSDEGQDQSTNEQEAS